MSAHLCVSLSCMYNYIDETNTDSSTRSEIATITTRTQTHKQCHCHSTITAMLNNPACLRLYTFATMVTSFDLHCAVSSHCDPGERERKRDGCCGSSDSLGGLNFTVEAQPCKALFETKSCYKHIIISGAAYILLFPQKDG